MVSHIPSTISMVNWVILLMIRCGLPYLKVFYSFFIQPFDEQLFKAKYRNVSLGMCGDKTGKGKIARAASSTPRKGPFEDRSIREKQT